MKHGMLCTVDNFAKKYRYRHSRIFGDCWDLFKPSFAENCFSRYVQTTVSCNIFSYFFWHGMLCYWVPINLKTSPPGLMFFKHIRGSIMCTCFRNQGVKGQKMTSMIFFSQFILFFVSSISFSLRSDFLLDVYNKNFTPCIVMCCG